MVARFYISSETNPWKTSIVVLKNCRLLKYQNCLKVSVLIKNRIIKFLKTKCKLKKILKSQIHRGNKVILKKLMCSRSPCKLLFKSRLNHQDQMTIWRSMKRKNKWKKMRMLNLFMVSLVYPRNKRVGRSGIKLNYPQITFNSNTFKTKLIVSKLMEIMNRRVCIKSLEDSWLSRSHQWCLETILTVSINHQITKRILIKFKNILTT